jgi:capsule polysaccharide export protein KpsC/LpsZ
LGYNFKWQFDYFSYALERNLPVYIFEDGFIIRSIGVWFDLSLDQKYKEGASFTIDDRTVYFDAIRV